MPLVALTRGGILESVHHGSVAVVDLDGRILFAAGDPERVTFTRSALKPFQALPFVAAGGIERFGLSGPETALLCASHSGEPRHVEAAAAILAKAGNTAADLRCGTHAPSFYEVRGDVPPPPPYSPLAHNCSGKHAGMLALARQLGVDPKGYTGHGHPVQRAIAKAMGRMCDCDLDRQPWGVDGCSVPTWAIPLRNMALGFARLCAPDFQAGQRILAAVRAHPFMVAGTGRFDTDIMVAVPRLFVKGGAEGVHCGCIPHAGLGIALKCDDGAGRASDVAMAALLAGLDVWTAQERESISAFARHPLHNWRRIHVGDVQARSA